MIKNDKGSKTIRKIFILFIAFCIFSEFIFPNLFSKISISEASARSKDRSKPVEIISNRDIYSKHYLNSDGTITAIINSAPIHYKNTFGEYEDIDLTITSAGNDKAQKSNTKNNFKIYFEDKNDSKNTTYACMEITNRNGDARWISYKLAGAKSSSDDYYKNKFTFSNVFENVDLEYEINTTQLKENIIIAQPINNYEFNFIVEISEGITLAKSFNGEIIASDNVTKEELFIIAKPFAEDSNGLRTNDVTQEIEKKSYKGKVYVDPDSFVFHSGPDTYYVSYRYAGEGVIAYDYTKVTNWQQVGKAAIGIVLLAGAAYLIVQTGGAAAPVLVLIAAKALGG